MKTEMIAWKPRYELGVEDIDFQHHFFLNLINRLASELQGSDATDYRTALISELNAYARFHFISEENLMSRSQYPEVTKHKMLHLELIDQLSSRENMLLMEHSDQHSTDIVNFLIHWFLDHTTTVDRLFADYLLNKNR